MAVVPYMERTRAWYDAQGYDKPYAWAQYDVVPFAALEKPLAESVVGVVVTATATGPDGKIVLPKQVYSRSTNPPPESLYTDDLAWDKEATHTDDRETYLPIDRLQELVAAGRIAAVAPRFHGVPTDYSQRRTETVDAPEILARLREDAADVALLVPL
jgi:hypothetical protein